MLLVRPLRLRFMYFIMCDEDDFVQGFDFDLAHSCRFADFDLAAHYAS